MEKRNFSAPEPRRTTAVFAKRPEPGRAKTRLTPPLAPGQAAELAEAMLRDLMERLAVADGFRTALCFAPDEARGWFASAFPRVDLRPQVGDGLAQRLAHFFREELVGTVGSTAVAIGSDVPLADPTEIARAHAALRDGADLVLGPDGGGGYWLVGMREPHTRVFEVEMSTASMYDETLALARELGLAVELVAEGYDVDREADLGRLALDLGRLAPEDPLHPRRTAACVAKLGLDGGASA